MREVKRTAGINLDDLTMSVTFVNGPSGLLERQPSSDGSVSVSWMTPFSQIKFRDYDTASCPSCAAIGKVAKFQRCRPLGFKTLPGARNYETHPRNVQ